MGRTNAWLLSPPDAHRDRYYLKLWSQRATYDRALSFITLINRLAAIHDWVAPVPLVYADSTNYALVTRPVPGQSLDVVLSHALKRYTFNSKRRGKFWTLAENSIDLLCRFLRELHALNHEPIIAPVDYQPSAVILRVNKSAELLRQNPVTRRFSFLNSFPIDPQSCARLTNPLPDTSILYGDLSPRNIFTDGKRLAFIDYDDVGVGPACRDYLYIEYLLEQFDWLLPYNTAKELVRIVHSRGNIDVDTVTSLHKIYRLEFLLAHLRLAAARYSRASAIRRLHERLEIGRVSSPGSRDQFEC